MAINLLGVIFLLLLPSVLLYLVHLARGYKSSNLWPMAEGMITACKIRTYSPKDGRRHWYISINYKYLVEGKTYSSLETSEMFAFEE